MPPAARIMDQHLCPMQTPVGPATVPHVGGPILGPGEPTVTIGGMPASVVGDSCMCTGMPAMPDSISIGSMTVMIGGKPAVRMGDTTAHGGKVLTGWPTVMIGG